ncbi:MAG: hypothetical protein NVS3B20_22010 [Polyangiales bacterium]
MTVRSARDHVEAFHLCFLRLLMSGPDRSHYVVKGGCNLRFWMRSARYSEDLDLDVEVTAKAMLRNKIDRLLVARPLDALLRSQGQSICDRSAPKQTETTQRWKIALRCDGLSTPINTKVEFSRRAVPKGHRYEPVDALVARRHRMPAPIANHYLPAAALKQKISALAHRSVTQARDVFDAHLLLTALGGSVIVHAGTQKDLALAIERSMTVSYDEFGGQVVAFLEEEHRPLYASRGAWAQLQSEVVASLEGLVS